MSGTYTFKLVVEEDLPLLSGWLDDPRVKQWYTDDDYIEDLEDSLEDDRIRMQIVSYKDEPIAFVQDYDLHAWNDHHLAYLPPGSRGIDTFIGRSELMGQGHGVRYLMQLCSIMFDDGIPALGIDPACKNTSAIKAYEKVGFVQDGEIENEWGRLLTLSLTRAAWKLL